MYNKKFTSREKFRLRHHPEVPDSVTHIYYYLKKEKEKLFLEFLDGFAKFGMEGAYFRKFEPITVIRGPESPEFFIVDSSVLNEIEDSILYPMLEDKRMYVLEKTNNCKYRRVHVTLANGLQYTK